MNAGGGVVYVAHNSKLSAVDGHRFSTQLRITLPYCECGCITTGLVVFVFTYVVHSPKLSAVNEQICSTLRERISQVSLYYPISRGIMSK